MVTDFKCDLPRRYIYATIISSHRIKQYTNWKK